MGDFLWKLEQILRHIDGYLCVNNANFHFKTIPPDEEEKHFFIFLVSVSNSILWISSMLWKQSQVISSQSQNANFFPNKSYCFAVQVKIFLEPWPNWLEFFNFDINIGWIHIIQRSTFSLLKMPTSPSTLKSSIYKSSLTGDF